MLRGVYALVITLKEEAPLPIKTLGNPVLKPGCLVYVGSAMGTGSTNLKNRIRRHFRREKKVHWHIDHLLTDTSRLAFAVWAESRIPMECRLIQRLVESVDIIPETNGFGASDCSEGCYSHLLRYTGKGEIREILEDTFRSLRMIPYVTLDGFLEAS
ncbi:MAG: GIY-YIG nuclease family protein [Candidatus Thorarchaeota archaeon]